MTIIFKNFIGESEPGYKPLYHDNLNQDLWDGDELDPKVHTALMKIADEFEEFLEIPSLGVVDVTMTGSMANYNWTSKSDIDLHLIVKRSDIECSDIDPNEYFMAKKGIWNDNHNITIFGHPVELYVQMDDEPHTSTGVYSLSDSEWRKKPEHKEVNVDDEAVGIKAREIMVKIDRLVDSESDDISAIDKVKDSIKRLRKVGLERDGELSVENLAFKALRNNGYLEKLYTYGREAKDKSLSID